MQNGNTMATIFRGETGQVLNATLSDENGPIDLSLWTVSLTVWQDEAAPVFEDEPAVIANQTLSRGRVSFHFDETTSMVPAGVYHFRFKGINSNDDPFYFPKTIPATNGTLLVQESEQL